MSRVRLVSINVRMRIEELEEEADAAELEEELEEVDLDDDLDDGESPYTAEDLEMDLADRLKKSRRMSGLSVQHLAAELGVHRNTVSAWIRGQNTPSIAEQREWARLTGVPYEWLRDGTMTT